MKKITPGAVLLLATLVTGCAGVGDLSVSDPRCEYRVNPLGIDASQPRLGWRLASDVRAQRQAAYQILVGSSKSSTMSVSPVSASTTSSVKSMRWPSGTARSNATVKAP